MEKRRSRCPSGRWASAFCLLLFFVAMTAGCGGDRLPVRPVEGTVTYNGKALESGTITFVPSSGPVATGVIRADGTFHLTTYRDGDGAVLGTHQVAVGAFRDPTPEEIAKAAGSEPLGSVAVTPQKYLAPATSGLSAEVRETNQPFQFNLTD